MRFQYRAAGPIAAVFILAALAGCSRTQQDWRVAQAAGTARAYEAFAARHPHSELAGVAHQRIAQLNDETAWRRATRANTAAAYQAYLAQYPNGSWSQDARIRMESDSMTPAGAPPAGPAAAGAAAPPATSAGPPATPAAPPAGSAATSAGAPIPRAASAGASSPGAPGPFAVQLGAYSSLANAAAAWRRLAGKHRPELRGRSDHVVPVSVSGRQLYRLEVSVADRAAARRLCRQLQQHGQDCLPVP